MIAPLATVAIGLLVMLAPLLLGYAPARNVTGFDRIAGPLLVALGVLSLWEPMAFLRWPATAVGAALVTSPLWLKGAGISFNVFHFIAGLLAIGVNLVPRGKRGRYGSAKSRRLDRIEWS